jgi:hypothetical protein
MYVEDGSGLWCEGDTANGQEGGVFAAKLKFVCSSLLSDGPWLPHLCSHSNGDDDDGNDDNAGDCEPSFDLVPRLMAARRLPFESIHNDL